MAAKACGNVTESTINAAVFLELLHTATLIHDDVIDETKQRRGVPSLNAIFDNRVAVLTGDYVLSSALIRSIQTGNLRIYEIAESVGISDPNYFSKLFKKYTNMTPAQYKEETHRQEDY